MTRTAEKLFLRKALSVRFLLEILNKACFYPSKLSFTASLAIAGIINTEFPKGPRWDAWRSATSLVTRFERGSFLLLLLLLLLLFFLLSALDFSAFTSASCNWKLYNECIILLKIEESMNIQGDSLAEVLNGEAVNNKPRLANKERSATRKFKKL